MRLTWQWVPPPVLRSMLGSGLLWLVACHPAGSDAPAGTDSSSVRPLKELQLATGSFVYFGITTFVRTDCARYEQQFPKATPFSIKDPNHLRLIRQHLENLQIDTTGQHTNVRAKVILRYSDLSQDTLCMGQFTSDYQGHTVALDATLYGLLGVDPRW